MDNEIALLVPDFEDIDEAEAFIAKQAGNMRLSYILIGLTMKHSRDKLLFHKHAETWESYCEMAIPGKSWQYDHTTANRIINASVQARELPPGTPIPPKESQLRALRQLTKDPEEQAAILKAAASIGEITTTTIKAAASQIETERLTGGFVPTVDGLTMTNAQAAASIEAAETAKRQQQYIIDSLKRKDELAGRVNVIANVEMMIRSANAEQGIITLAIDPDRARNVMLAFSANRGLKFWLTIAHALPPKTEVEQ